MRARKIAYLLKEAVQEFLADNCPHLAAAISYYLLFSLFPLTLAMLSGLGFLLRSPELQAKIVEGIGNFLPVSGDLIASTIGGVAPAWGAMGILATFGLAWAGMSVFNVIRKSLNTAWGVKQPRPFLHDRLIELAMMAGAGFLLLLSLSLTTGLQVARELTLKVPLLGPLFLNSDFLWNSFLTLLSTGLAFMVFLFLYKFIPNTRVRWRDIWVGALLAAILFEAAKRIFMGFAGEVASYNVVYGSISTVIGLLVWIYVSSVILLFCAKLCTVFPKAMALAKPQPEEVKRPKSRPSLHWPLTLLLSIAMLGAIGLAALRRLVLRKD